ncbi:MAG: alpha/beta hydrolase [Actinomycetota bacterium]|nr:alpha/beta hydrolase [Actinomycetota bacterium]MDQ2956516.1 alpha/beta hydrolase [Actinomycetota bacterium]
MTIEFDPGTAGWLELVAAEFDTADKDGTADMVATARDQMRAVSARARSLVTDLVRPRSEQRVLIPAEDGPLPALVVRPEADPLAIIVFFHGGGWIGGDLDTHLQHARRLSGQLPAVVVSVDYRMAPEHLFPAAYDDCLAATRWVADHSIELGGRALPLVVAGDSAGAQLAASVAIGCAELAVPLAAQLLIVPVADVRGWYRDETVNARYPSRSENAEGYGLTLDAMAAFAESYRAGDDWRASPVLADSFTGLPPAAIYTAGFDPLRDEGFALAERLTEAGVRVLHRHLPSLNHSYFALGGVSETAARAAAQAAEDLRSLLGE